MSEPSEQNDLDDFDDMHCSLQTISERHPKEKATSQLADIQSSLVAQQKSHEFIKNLECLHFVRPRKRRRGEENPSDAPSTVLGRRSINALKASEYVALSYTWSPSPAEEESGISTGGYRIQETQTTRQMKSPVRDAVFRRIQRYMDHIHAENLWIDQHCIHQEPGDAKEIGMQAMDLVYSLSKYPTALLSQCLVETSQLKLLTEILSGRLVRQDRKAFHLSPRISPEKALSALELLHFITSDPWFKRGWTFQENYRAGIRMVLLIPHCKSLNYKKAAVFLGSLDEELCVSSVSLQEEATKLCLAYQSEQPPPPIISSILVRAGKYTILLQSRDPDHEDSAPVSMSPKIIADLAARELTMRWDCIPIVANCCQYSIRLDSTALRAKGHSLSLSILALCLINGEILSNHPDRAVDVEEARAMTMPKFLQSHFFVGLQAPGAKRKLTFNKGCRLANVRLTEEGIETEGYLWRLDEVIRTNHFPREQPSSKDKHDECPRIHDERWRLGQLIDELSLHNHKSLSTHLDELINTNQPDAFVEEWKTSMASTFADAIHRGKTFCTASLVTGEGEGVAIFIVSTGRKAEWDSRGSFADSTQASSGTVESLYGDQAYIFTSFRAERGDSQNFDVNDVDRHVSLEVDCPSTEGSSGPRYRLFTKRWIHGLCFFSGCPPHDVVFPWPASLAGL